MKVMMTGGGTLGPVTPLLAVAEALPEAEFVWVGTPQGPERAVVEKYKIPFFAFSAPKVDRYAPGKWLLVPLGLLISIRQAWKILQETNPDVIVTAGGYVSVPIVWVGWLMRIPIWVHQQDMRPGLANKIMAPFATGISVAWRELLEKFPSEKTLFIGNPVRNSVRGGSREAAAKAFHLDQDHPTVVVFGGGTGSMWINKAVTHIAPALAKRANILHLTGRGKQELQEEDFPHGYKAVEFVKERMGDVLALADVVVCRAGMGTISELAALRKPAIIIPIPGSHQEDNTKGLEESQAAVVLHQNRITPQILEQEIIKLLNSPPERTKLGGRLNSALPTDRAADELAHHIKSIA